MKRRTDTEIVISDVIKLFKGKKLFVLLSVIICVALGIGYTLVSTFLFGNFGNTVSFRLFSPECADKLLPILESTSFSEKLLLDENGLPDEELCDPKDYKTALEAIEAYKQGVENARNAAVEAKGFYYNIVLSDGTTTTWEAVSQNYEKLQKKCTDILTLLNVYKSANAEAVVQDPNHVQKTAEYEIQLAEAISKRDTFEKEVYQKALEKKSLLDRAEAQEFSKLRQLRKNAEQQTEKVLSVWRKNAEIKRSVKRLSKALTFELNEIKSTDMATTFINVSVSVPRDKEFADYVIERLSTYFPENVCKNVELLTNSIDTNCTLITPFSDAKNLDTTDLIDNLYKKVIVFTLIGIGILLVTVIGKEYLARVMSEDDK